MKKYISIAIMMSLLSGRRYTASALAEKYETSVKTIYRAIDTLIEANMPIACFSGKNGGYELIKESKINSSFFTLQELCSFITFLKSNNLIEKDSAFEERLGVLLEKPYGNDLNKLCGQMIIDTDMWGENTKSNIQVDTIKAAIEEQRRLIITYNKDCLRQSRTIEPYTLVYKAGVWYVYAYCEDKMSYRLFRLSRIENIVKGQPFERKDIDLTKRPWNKDFNDNLEEIDIELTCDSTTLPELLDWLGSNVKITPSGFIKSTAHFSQGLVHRLMLFGPKVKVVSPEKLKIALKEECIKISEQYA